MNVVAESHGLPVGARHARLTLRFLLWTTIAMTGAAIVVFLLVRHEYTLQGKQGAIDRMQLTVTAVLLPRLRAADLEAAPTPARRRALERLFDARVLVQGTALGTIYDAGGNVLFTTGRALKASSADAPSPVTIRRVLAGAIVAGVGDRAGVAGRALEVDVPVSVNGRTRAIVELDQRFGPIGAAATRTALLVAGVLEALLLVLLVALGPPLSRASTRLSRHIDELDHLATHDSLTGMLNRLGLQRAFEEAPRDGHVASLFLLDLDAYDEVNEALGSSYGDALLASWSERLRPEALGAALVARSGEDEFAILLESNNRFDIERLVGKLRESLSDHVELEGLRIALDVSIGVALAPEHGTGFDGLLRCAGVALTAARQEQSKFALYDAANDDTNTGRVGRTAELRDALRNGEFVVHYQPQADLATHAIRAVEALVRWQHPREGLLAAEEFINYAERTGIVVELDRFVLETAARQWLEWSKAGIELDLAVNLATADLLDERLPNDIASLLRAYSLPAHRLVLEITERRLLQDRERTREILGRLNAIGVRLALDDYGIGYSSLDYLRRLPVQQVKLDRRFIAGLPHDPTDLAIVRSTTELAHILSATVVAEGIERREQWESAASQGCDIAQGNHIGRPQSAHSLTELLHRARAGPRAWAREMTTS
jgi:diguanylate cyclase (GGDEF)-like protein